MGWKAPRFNFLCEGKRKPNARAAFAVYAEIIAEGGMLTIIALWLFINALFFGWIVFDCHCDSLDHEIRELRRIE